MTLACGILAVICAVNIEKRRFAALCFVSVASVVIDLTILFVYNSQSFMVFDRQVWAMQNALIIIRESWNRIYYGMNCIIKIICKKKSELHIRNLKNIAMMLLPMATASVACILYDTMNQKHLWGWKF